MKHTEQDLDWLAFRYVAGEMTAAESLDFETLLSHDQPARDAVVQAVELSQTLLAAQSLGGGIAPAAATQQTWSGRLAWIACGAAACLVVALALNFAGTSQPGPTISHELADAWNAQLENAAGVEAEEVPGDGSDADFVHAEIPSWMVDAVRSLHDDQPADDDSNSADEMES